MLRRTVMALGLSAVAIGQLGCMVKADDGEKFREPIPVASEVKLSAASDGAATKSAQAVGSAGTDPGYAKFYQFTRNVTDGVDFVTGVILGSVWIVVHTRPTTVSEHEATWGPGSGDALSPVVWRLKVTEVSKGVFDYRLDGRPKDSTSESDYLAVLTGRGYGKAHPEHRNGWFQVDNDAAQKLDPTRNHDHGTAKVTHHLSSWPLKITAELRPTPDPNWVDVTVTHSSDGSGALDLSGLTDVEEVLKDGKLEDIVMHNRWAKTGAGRADVQISGGSMASLVKATECWSTSFYRSYYTDNVNYQPTAGDPAACAFPDAQF